MRPASPGRAAVGGASTVRSRYELDIDGQPDALRDFAASALPDELAGLDLDEYDRIVLTGMGSSHVAAHQSWSTLVSRGRAAWWVSTAQLLAVPELVTADSLLWITSQSGESGEVVALVDTLARERRPRTLLATTNARASPLGSNADIVISLESGAEGSVSTKTYVATLAAHRRIVAALLGGENSDSDIVEEIRSAAEELGRFSPSLVSLASATLRGPDVRVVLVASSPALSSALIGALVLKEAAKVPAEGFLRGDFRHGPLELAGPGLVAVLFGSGVDDAPLELLSEELLQSGALVAYIDPGHRAVVCSQTIATNSASALGRLVCGAKFAQLLSIELARARAVEPGVFRFGRKITATL
jgi:glucosamine--fructose-6-phosphate aminotransferase (isomerizing)